MYGTVNYYDALTQILKYFSGNHRETFQENHVDEDQWKMGKTFAESWQKQYP